MKIFESWRYKRKLKHWYLKLYEWFFFDYQEAVDHEKEKFAQAHFLFEEGEKKLNEVLREIGRGPFDRQLDSIHWLLFSCLSLREPKLEHILEIGTARGVSAAILSRLFPHAQITSIDLPVEDPLMRRFYSRDTEKKLQKYLRLQNENTKRENIQLVQTNSFFLPEVLDIKFDLIWIDGGHLYPDIAWDICNAWHLSKAGGHIMVDDVIPVRRKYVADLVSTDSHQVIEYIRERVDIKPLYFLKRINPESFSRAVKKKYVVYFRKVKG